MQRMATPAIELDTSSAPSPMYNNSDSLAACSSNEAQGSGGQGGSSSAKYANGPHIRSRITVVCAECKRLKLKCDRRTPCSSCLKRDTVQRCVYSQAAAEKIDIQSIHNRLLVVEGHLAQLSAASPTSLTSLPPFKSSYPSSTPPQPLPVSSSQSATSSTPQRAQPGPSAGFSPSNDHALLVTGSSGSSVMVSLDSTASLWLPEMDTPSVFDDAKLSISPYSSAKAGPNLVRVKLEPTPSSIPSPPGVAASTLMHPAGGFSGYAPPLPHTVFIPASDPRLSRSGSSNLSDTSSSTDIPQVTPALLRYLPSMPNTRTRYMQSLTELMLMHPSFNVQHFERRVEAMLSWGETNDPTATKRDLARELFLGAGGKKGSERKERGAPPPPPTSSPKPTLSFFSATCAAFALGALMTGDSISDSSASSATAASSSTSPSPDEESIRQRSTSHTALFALSEQTLGLFEKTSPYDLDSVVAMLLQVLYMLHDGQMRVAQSVFPLIGKMVNVARMMGLAMDPDEFAGTYSLFEAEARRRVWWDVYHYDMLVSECMGQQPLILENSFTTKIPADVDEEKFSSSSTTLPAQSNESGEAVPTYLSLRCRLAQVVKSIHRQAAKDLADDEVSLEQAASGEAEISSWLSDLPQSFRLNMEADVTHPMSSSPSTSPFLMAQRCTLVIAANRVVLQLYTPFMKDSSTPSGSKLSHQALMGTINAAHSVIYASRILHFLWRDTRPTAFDFYDFGRSLFDAAVVCAHTVIHQPKSILAAEAIKGLSGALEVMRSIDNLKAGHEATTASEAVRIVELMKDKAERARAQESTAGTKRKRNDSLPLPKTSLANGLQLPYVGPSVSSVKPEQPRIAPLTAKIATVTGSRRDSLGNTQGEPKAMKTSSSDKKEKSTKYPTIGIRVRSPHTAAPASQVAIPAAGPTGRRSSVAPVNSAVQSPITPADRSQHSALGVRPNAPYQYPQTDAPSAPPPQQEPPPSGAMMHDFQIEYNGSGGPSHEHYQGSFTSESSPGSSVGYECPQPPSSVPPYDNTPPQPPPAFRPPPPSEYYMPSPFTPSPSGYEQHQQNLSMPAYSMHPSLDTAITGGVHSIPGTPRDSYLMLSDKSSGTHYDPQLGKSELNRQMASDYQQTATSHGMAIASAQMTGPYVQGWRPDNSWEYNKFYGPHA